MHDRISRAAANQADACAAVEGATDPADGRSLLPAGATPVVEPLLDELSIICPSLIESMDGAQRRVAVRPLWEEPNPNRRAGPHADTFMEFQERVRRFINERLSELPDGTVIFGHGIWCGMLQWQLDGNQVEDAAGMRAFRRYQQGLQMANCNTVLLKTIEHTKSANALVQSANEGADNDS